MRNEDFIEAFLNYQMEYYSLSFNTYAAYKASINYFAEWLKEMTAKNLVDTEFQDIFDYRKFLIGKDYRNATISIRLHPLKYMFNWASAPNVNIIAQSPFPEMAIEGSDTHCQVIPIAKDILRVRSEQRVNTIRAATTFEVLLSSGMRISEYTQLRCCDFEFDHRCMDYELARVSPYVGARIDLTKGRGIRTKGKGGKRRVTYISRLAAKLVKRSMEIIGLDENSPLPLFPFTRQVFGADMYVIGRGLFSEKKENKAPIIRKSGFTDIDQAQLEGLSVEYRLALKKIQDQEKKLNAEFPARERAVRIERKRKQTLHPHALRHFFAVMQYYRNYHGNRRDLLSVRDMLGHSGVGTTDIYVTGETYIENDLQWKQIMLGNGTEYLDLLR